MSLEQRPAALPSGVASIPSTSSAALRWVQFACDPLPFSEADAPGVLGGKGASLWLLNRAGLAVPPSFTLTTEACRHYHTHERQWPAGLWDEVRSALVRLEEMTGLSFGRGPIPMTLAVRSGAAQSMPGLLATYLHCGLTESLVRELDQDAWWAAFAESLRDHPALVGQDAEQRESHNGDARQYCERLMAAYGAGARCVFPNDPELLLHHAITAVFDSWEGPAARQFREASGWDHAAGTAVTIQAMFPSAVAGVAFSINPAQPLREEFVIEAVAGSGRSLVGGQTTPSRWYLNRTTHTIRECSMPPSLVSNESLAEFGRQGLLPLCEALPRIEAILQAPVDVEFGYAAGRLVFFQARPIVQSPAVHAREVIRLQEVARLRDWVKRGRTLWVRHNLAETLPAPTPLTWDLWRDFMSGRGGFGNLYRRLGYRPSSRVFREGFLELIAGRIYADPERLTEMLGAGYPLTFDPQVLRNDPQAINRPPTRLDLERLDPWFLWKWPWLLFGRIRSSRRQRGLADRAAAEFDTTVVPNLRAYVEQERQIDLSRLTIPQLVELFEKRRDRVFNELAPQTLLPGTLGAAAWGSLEQQLRAILGDAECQAVMNHWLQQIANPVAVRERELLAGKSQGGEGTQAFLREFGHRGPNEMDLSAPRWRECPDKVESAAAVIATLPAECVPLAMPVPTDDHLREVLERYGAGCLYRELAPLLRQALTLLPYREIGKHVWLQAYELLRTVVTELSQRLNLGDGVHLLTAAELSAATPISGLDELIAARRDQHRLCQQLHVPHVIDANGDLAEFGRPGTVTGTGRVFPATPLSAGTAAGRVHLWDGQQAGSELGTDAIIVASTIDPGSLPFLATAAALVVEQGGLLSHVALLARQFSIPTVMCPHITSHVRHGESIYVDADQGLLELRDRSA